MKNEYIIVYPNYYKDFKCIADKCTHTCCKGWEIEIDREREELFNKSDGEFGNKLRKNIVNKDGCKYFRLGNEERCPFLNDSGLCDIIINMGESYLTEICKAHPRYRQIYNNRVEVGLGLACEEACRIILSQKNKTEFIYSSEEDNIFNESYINDDCRKAFENAEADNLGDGEILKRRMELVELAQNREKSLDKRLEEIISISNINITSETVSNLAYEFSDYEIMDNKWKEKLSELKNGKLKAEIKNYKINESEIPYEKLLVYFIHRYTMDAESTEGANFLAAVASVSVMFINLLCKCGNGTFKELQENARIFSSEIEYSEENMELFREYIMFA